MQSFMKPNSKVSTSTAVKNLKGIILFTLFKDTSFKIELFPNHRLSLNSLGTVYYIHVN
jgi:hypothetical protein